MLDCNAPEAAPASPDLNPPALVSHAELPWAEFDLARASFPSRLERTNILERTKDAFLALGFEVPRAQDLPPLTPSTREPNHQTDADILDEQIDSLPSVVEPPLPPTVHRMPRGQGDPAYDGAYVGSSGFAFHSSGGIFDVPPVTPYDPTTLQEGLKIIYVNGMSTSLDGCWKNMLVISNSLGAEVWGIYNATEGDVPDVMQAVGDKLRIGTNPAVETLREEILAALERGQHLHLFGESHGGLVISCAVSEAKEQLANEGLNREQIEKALQIISVETFGGASWSYPDGPRYVHYVNEQDPVPFRYGLTPYGMNSTAAAAMESNLVEPRWIRNMSNILWLVDVEYFAPRYPGKDGKIIRFSEPAGNDWIEAHSIKSYLPSRRPFEKAYGVDVQKPSEFEVETFVCKVPKWIIVGAFAWGAVLYSARAAKRTVNFALSPFKRGEKTEE